jgi:hypothetical protein
VHFGKELDYFFVPGRWTSQFMIERIFAEQRRKYENDNVYYFMHEFN